MMNFVNHGTDEAILKSLNAETPDEELVKAMNKQGLVQKDVQVRSKHGVFTRKQWVRTGEAKSTGAGSTSTAEDKEPEGSSFPASVGKYLRGQGFKHYNPGQGDQHDKYESNKFTVYSLGGGKYEISGEVNSEYEEPRNVDLKTLKQMVGGSSEKSTNKKLLDSAPDLTSEQIDKMKNRDVMDTLLSLSHAGDDGIATGKNPGDAYYMFNDTDGYSDAIHKTTVKAAEEGDPDVGKDMSAKAALKEICGCGKSSKKAAPKKLIASAPDLTSEQIDSMKIEDVYDYMNDMAGGADSDGIACGTKDSDTYYQFTDSDDPEEMVCKTTVGAAADGDLDSGKTMSIRGALKELCGY